MFFKITGLMKPIFHLLGCYFYVCLLGVILS